MNHACRALVLLCGFVGASSAIAQQATEENSKPTTPAAEASTTAEDQSAREKAFSEMLSGATLEGSFTSTGADRDPSKLSRDKYTIGQVTKIAGNLWLIPARVQYGERDFTLPVTVPIRWAGDTPVIVVDNVPGLKDMSARVLFFADHYAGYWRHGDHGGHLFGTISRENKPAQEASQPAAESSGSVADPPVGKQNDK